MLSEQDVMLVMAYLVGAYPNKELPEATVAVFVDQLVGWNERVDVEVLLVAARNHVGASVFFPTVAELKRVVQRVLDGRRLWEITMNSQWEEPPANLYLPGGISAMAFWQRLALSDETLNVQGGGE